MATARETRGSSGEAAFWTKYERFRYTILFYTLLLTLFILPAASTMGMPAVLLKILVGACLLSAVMPNATKRTRRIVLAAVLVLILAQFVPEQPRLGYLFLVLHGVAALTGLVAAVGTLRFAISTSVVSRETLYAALGTYLLAGLFFGQIYWLIESASPGSITGPDPVTQLTTIYYSFVTLATLGYGDYLPRSDLTRGVATFEVIGGQLFLAVLVARLIGSFGTREA